MVLAIMPYWPMPLSCVIVQSCVAVQVEIAAAAEKGEVLASVSQDVRLDNRALDLRTPANQAIFKLQSAVCQVRGAAAGCAVHGERVLSSGQLGRGFQKLVAGSLTNSWGSCCTSLQHMTHPCGEHRSAVPFCLVPGGEGQFSCFLTLQHTTASQLPCRAAIHLHFAISFLLTL